MAKKTTGGKGSSRQKKSTDSIEDAEVVDASAPTTQDQDDAVPQDAVSEAADAADADLSHAKDPETADATVETAETEADASEVQADDADVTEEAGAEETDTPADGEPTDAGEGTAEETDADDDGTTDGDEADADSELDDTGVGDESSLPEPEPEPAPIAPPPAPPEEKKASAVPLVIGGLVAGAIGFGAAYFSGTINPPPVPEPVDLSGLEQSIDAQAQRLEEVAASIPEVSAPAEVPTVDLSGIETNLASIVDSLADLEARVAALESRPAGTSGAADPALLDELTALKATVTALQEANEAAQENARSAAAGALQRAAMTRVQTALDTGAPFADALAELQDLGLDVPETLATSAAEGVPTLASLQDAFPEAARTALAADRAEAAESGETGGVVDFLRSQLGARSLTPQEGDSTDAVLSRVEHALHEGRLADALAEIDTLPDVAQPAMAAWSSIAAARADALSAAQALMDSLN